MTSAKTEQLSLRMSPRAKVLLRIAANREHRSASNMVEHLILSYCEQQGISDVSTPSEEQNPDSKDSL